MAPTTMNGSRPFTTSSGNSASGGSCDRSNPRAKNRKWARRRCVPCVGTGLSPSSARWASRDPRRRGKHKAGEAQRTVPTPVIRDCPRYSARPASVVGPLDDLTEPVGVLRRIDSVGIGRRSFDETRRADQWTVPNIRDCPHHQGLSPSSVGMMVWTRARVRHRPRNGLSPLLADHGSVRRCPGPPSAVTISAVSSMVSHRPGNGLSPLSGTVPICCPHLHETLVKRRLVYNEAQVERRVGLS